MLKNEGRKLFIYGTGTFARDIFDVLIQHGLKVNSFLDHLPRQTMIKELSVSSPDTIPMETRSDSTIIIGIHNRAANIAALISRLKLLGFAQIITPIELYDEFTDDLGVRFWMTRRNFYNDYKQEINSTKTSFADKTSRELYESLILFRTSGDYSIIPQPDLEHQYFPPDIPAWKTPLRLVDCGAFDGDTLKNFINANISIEAVAAFEPDLINFRKLSQFVKENQNHLPHTSLWPCGVFSSTTQLHFATGRGESSNITNAGESTLQCISLDEAISTFTPNLIKMDIEGAEVEALRGAQYILQEARPGLAISVYHRPEHLWEIPLLIERLMRGSYQYYLRSHGFNDFDIVLYAIPV